MPGWRRARKTCAPPPIFLYIGSPAEKPDCIFLSGRELPGARAQTPVCSSLLIQDGLIAEPPAGSPAHLSRRNMKTSPLAGKPATHDAAQRAEVDLGVLHRDAGPSIPGDAWPSVLRVTGLFAQEFFQRRPHPGHHPGDLPLSKAATDRRAVVYGDGYACAFPSAQATALEVLAANGVEVMIAARDEYTPTPAVSLAILTYKGGSARALPMASSLPLA